MDIATLGFEVRSEKLVAANDELRKMPAAASAAERAAERWGMKTSGAAAHVEKEVTLAAAAVGALSGALKAAAVIALGVGSTIVSAFGLQKFMGETESVSGAVKTLGETWASAFDIGKKAATPLRNAIEDLTIALENESFLKFVHVIGEMMFGAMTLAVQGATLLVSGLGALVENIDTIAVGAATAGTILLVAFGPAIMASLIAGFTALGAAGVSAISAITAAIAANPFGALAVGIVAAVTALYAFRDEIKQAIGVDVIGIVKKAANYIIGSFVAAYGDIKFLWQNFPDIMSAAFVGAVNAAIRGINDMVKTAAEGINKVIDVANKLKPGKPFDRVGTGAAIPELENPAAGRLGVAVQARGAQQQAELNADYLGKLGDALKRTEPEARRFKDTLGDTAKAAKGVKEALDPTIEAYAKIVRNAEQFIAMQQLEQQTLFMTTEAAARLRFEQELLNKAADAHIKLTPQQYEQLGQLATQMAAAQTRTSALKDAVNFAKSTFGGFFGELRNGLQQGQSVWQAFGSAAVGALNRISDKLIQMATDRLFDNALGGSSGGGGGLFGSLLTAIGLGGGGQAGGYTLGGASAMGGTIPGVGNLGQVGTWAKGGAFSRGNVIPFARGGVVNGPTLFPMANGAGLMGEAGPEAVMPLRRGADGRLGVSMHGRGQQAAPVQPVVIRQTMYFGSDVNSATLRTWGEKIKRDTMAELVERQRRNDPRARAA